MSRSLTNAVLAASALMVTGSLALAQPGAGRGMGMPRYDKSTEVTVKGTVEAVLSHQGRMPMGGTGTHLTFKTDSGTLDVHLGPTNWLADNKIEFAVGDQLEVLGSSVEFNGQKALIAREITKGDRKITLRNANGVPVWAGRGRRTQS